MLEKDIASLKKVLVKVEEFRLHLLKSIAALEQADRIQIFDPETGDPRPSLNRRPENIAPALGKEPAKVKTAMDAIRDAVGSLQEFSSRDVDEFIKMRYPRIHSKLGKVTIPNALYKMQTKQVIRQVVKGVNGNPSRFVRGGTPSVARN